MAYQIEYDSNQITVIRRNAKKEILFWSLLVVMLVVGTICVHFCGAFLQMLILGDKNVTQAAAEQLVTDLKSGVQIQDAVQTFYSELIS